MLISTLRQRISSLPGESVAKPRSIVERGLGPLPVVVKKTLSITRAPTTTNPRLASLFPPPIEERHNVLFPKLLDRGSSQPVLGFRRVMPDGTFGGMTKGIKATLDDRRGTPIESASILKGAILNTEIKRYLTLSRISARVAPFISPGIGGLNVAKAPRIVPDTPSGLRGVIRDILSKKNGAFAQQLTMPKERRIQMIKDRLVRTEPKAASSVPDTWSTALMPTTQIEQNLNPESEGHDDTASVAKTVNSSLFLLAATIIGILILRR